MKRPFRCFCTLLFISACLFLLAADGLAAASVNDGFDPSANNTVRTMAIQPDGKIILGGNFTAIGGTTRNYIARLNTDGSLDATFNPNANNSVYSIAIQPDGKILIGGYFTTVGGIITRNFIARLNTDGSLDATFNPNANGAVLSITLQADGNIVIGGGFTTIGGTVRNYIARLNADGSLDATFNPNASSYVFSIALQPDGKILIGGMFTTIGGTTRNYIARLNANGSLDATFNPNASSYVDYIALQPDGKILIGGRFTTIGGTARNYIARLNANGSLDATFNPNANNAVFSIALQPDGKILIGGQFTTIGGTVQNRIARLNTNGSLDVTFNPNANNTVFSIALQPDGKILIGGAFTTIGGAVRNCIVRLNTDSSLDATFNPNANSVVYSIAIQPDGKILIGGEFTTIGGTARNRIARLNADGSLDATFNPNANNYVQSIALQTDGKIIVGGIFTTIGSTARNYIARFNADGSLDATFNPNANSYVYSVALQTDGKIVIGGNFTTIGGTTTRNRIARLNAADGSLDTTFDPNANSFVNSIAIQPDGKIIIGGGFTAIGGTTRNYIARLNADGNLDMTFNPSTNSYVASIALQPDGKILIGGNFGAIGGTARNRIARLNTNGSLDTTFNPDADNYVNSIALQPDGKIIIGGWFTTIGGTARNRIAGLSSDYAAIQNLSVSADGTAVTWLRSGSGPEIYNVMFEQSSDGSTWTALGTPTRISGGWQLMGLSLSFYQNSYIKARGTSTGGYQNGSHGIIESVRLFYNRYRYTLTVTKRGTGSGVVTSSPSGIACGEDCSEPYDLGTSVTLTATPDSESVFSGWSGEGCSGTGTCTVTMDATKTVTATFTDRIVINGGADLTKSPSVTLSLSASDLGSVVEMKFSTDNINWTAPEPYSTTKIFTLPGGDGVKIVYVKFKDIAGNWSNAFISTIILDTTQEIYRFERMWPTLQQPWYFIAPSACAIDKQGYVYVVDQGNHRIQKFTSSGQFVTKWGSFGFGVDGQFAYPVKIALDRSGNVYVTDSYNNRIQKFTSNGQFVMKWGSSGSDDGQFNRPEGIAIDGNENVYVADTNNKRIQKFTSDGQFVTKWGSSGSGDGQFNQPKDITIDGSGNVYVADSYNSRIQKFTASGQFITKWGTQSVGDGQASRPTGIVANASGNIYVADWANSHVQMFTSSGQLMNKWGSYGKADGQFHMPMGIMIDESGNVYVVDTGSNRIQIFTSSGQFVTQWGNGGSNNGHFWNPDNIAIDGNGNVYVSEYYGHRIQKFSFDGQYVDKWGSYGAGDSQFMYPRGIAIDGSGDVYVVDDNNFCIKKFTSGGVFITKWGTRGTGEGQFEYPEGIAIDGSGNIYVSDQAHRIQKFTSGGVFITKWGTRGTGDGQFEYPHGIATDSSGNVYVADTGNSRIQKFTSGGVFLTKLGSHGTGDSQFWNPINIAIDGSGNVYVSDYGNNQIKKFSPGGVLKTKWGARGSGPGMLYNPQSIAVAPSGLIYVGDRNQYIQVFRKVEVARKSKAIIVAGGGPFPGNDLWDATQMSANFAYRTLTYQGYTKDKIYYLTSSNIDLDDNGVLDDIAGDATNANLQNAITNWAKDADDVLVYLVDHGGTDSFRMSGNETLSSAQLASWLNTLQNNITGKVTVIYDACESGSFVGDLTPPAGKPRIIITSASPGESAYFVTQGSVSFSNYFWTHIFNGVNIKDAFELTRDAIKYTTSYQNPLLDANGNGTANEAEDLALVQNTYIGSGTVLYGSAPLIGSVSPAQTINNTSSALLYADGVTDADGIARVWAVIRPPNYNQGGSDNPVQDLPSIDLMPVGNDRYEATYNAFNISGTYQIAIYARDRIGNTSIPKITTVSVTNPSRRKAIIVAGGSQGDSFWPAIEKNVKLAYDALRFQGYTDDDIYLLSPASITGVTKVPVLSTKDNLNYAITGDWAKGNTQDIVLYLIGRGGSGIFRISETETVSATELKIWLDTLQGIIPGVVTVVYDAPLSGSFLPLLTPPAGKTRIILSSTGAAAPVYFLSNGNISFSRFFWDSILNGTDLRGAYINASRAMGFLAPGQTPLLDDNADGISTKSDGSIAMNHVLGFGITLAADNPLIGSVSSPEMLTGQTSITIWAKDVTTTGEIDSVWAILTPPGSAPFSLTVPITEASFIQLLYNPEHSRYEATCDSSTYGQYNIAIYAIDKDSTISAPSATTVTQTIGPDTYEDDNTTEQASVIILNDEKPQTHTFHAAGDEDWVKFYALKNQVYEMKAGNLGPNADVVLELYKAGNMATNLIAGLGDMGRYGEDELVSWTAPDSGIYYLKVRQYDPSRYGEGTYYDLKVYRPAAPDIGTITGIIISDMDLARIASATIQAGLGSALSDDGSFILKVEAGTVNLSVNAEGYNSTILQDVVVQAGQETTVNVSMVSLKPAIAHGDVNNDGPVDLADAILALKAVSGITSTVHKEADVNGDGKIGMAEVIYILQKAAGLRAQ